jgi:cytochrome c oxidase cbb3-type subunit 4
MELESMRSLMTVIAFTTFVGIVVWAWSGRKRRDFDQAARSVLADEEPVAQVRGILTTRGSGNE